VEVVVVGAAVGQPVDQPQIGMEGENVQWTPQSRQ
jgi:hypothetical protein